MFGYLRLIKKTIIDLDNYNLNKYLIIVTFITAILSLGFAYSIYYFFFEFLFETNNYQSQYSLVNKIFNSYLFYLISIIFKILIGFTIFGLVMVPVGAIVTGLFSDNIFDIINKKNIKKYKFKRKNNAFYLSMKFSISCIYKLLL